jgi:hypothetical protein
MNKYTTGDIGSAVRNLSEPPIKASRIKASRTSLFIAQCLDAGASYASIWFSLNGLGTALFGTEIIFFAAARFFGEAPEGRPWAIKREDRPAAFAAPNPAFLAPLTVGIPRLPIQSSILSPRITYQQPLGGTPHGT